MKFILENVIYQRQNYDGIGAASYFEYLEILEWVLIALQEKHYGYPLFRCMKSSVFHARSEGVVMAADSGQKNIQIVGTASMNTYDVALRVGSPEERKYAYGRGRKP